LDNNPHPHNIVPDNNPGHAQTTEDARFAARLKDALLLGAATSTLATPVKHTQLLEIIVETAARVTSAEAASLFLIDEETQELVFEVALGQKAEEVRKFRVPMGHGIAGLVAVTGQPMMVSDVQDDPRHASDISQSIGYVPRTILCVPLLYDDQVIGVIELFDKLGGQPFSMDDMDILGYFAKMASITIEQSRTRSSISALLTDVTASTAQPGDSGSSYTSDGIKLDAGRFAQRLEDSARYDQAIELAKMIQEIVGYGENEFKACQAILKAFVDYQRRKPQPGQGLGARKQ
jgi:GAF domain-containing protein